MLSLYVTIGLLTFRLLLSAPYVGHFLIHWFYHRIDHKAEHSNFSLAPILACTLWSVIVLFFVFLIFQLWLLAADCVLILSILRRVLRPDALH